MAPFPKHPWLRYSVRTLLVAVTIFCLGLGWAMQWIHERRQAIDRFQGVTLHGEADAPWPLWMLGESGTRAITVNAHGDSLRQANKRAQEMAPQIARLQELFPEAEIKTLRSWPYMDIGDFVPLPAIQQDLPPAKSSIEIAPDPSP
jgi:hypothetical protein